jgi:hypothetical protein
MLHAVLSARGRAVQYPGQVDYIVNRSKIYFILVIPLARVTLPFRVARLSPTHPLCRFVVRGLSAWASLEGSRASCGSLRQELHRRVAMRESRVVVLVGRHLAPAVSRGPSACGADGTLRCSHLPLGGSCKAGIAETPITMATCRRWRYHRCHSRLRGARHTVLARRHELVTRRGSPHHRKFHAVRATSSSPVWRARFAPHLTTPNTYPFLNTSLLQVVQNTAVFM